MGEAGRLRAAGDDAAADGIEETAAAMRARDEAADVAAVAERVVAVLRRTPDGVRLAWTLDLPEGIAAATDAEDLAQAFGALAENAARHARSAVAVSGRVEDGTVRLALRDDGPGIPEDSRAALVRRGARLDLSGPGTGLGLAIAAEIAEAASGRVELHDTGAGLAAELRLPRRKILTGSSGS